MWVMTTDGFYSAVQHRQKPHLLVVRSRTVEDALALKHTLAQVRVMVEVEHTPDFVTTPSAS